jgi:hypothetical protein
MRTESLLAHEQLCVHLRSFYGVEPCSPHRNVSTAVSHKPGGRFPHNRSSRLSRLRRGRAITQYVLSVARSLSIHSRM